jgi:hypothetical protein
MGQEEQGTNELVADSDGVYYVILTGEEDEKALSQIPKNAKVVYYDSAELRQSLKIVRESGNFEVLNAEVPLEKLLKDSPPLSFERINESFDGTHNTHCGDGETVSSWWNRNTSAKPGLTDGVEDHVYMIYKQDAHPWWNYVVTRNWGSQCTMEAYLTYNTSTNTPTFNVLDWTCNTSACPGQAGTGGCSASVTKSTLLNGYVANQYDGQHWFPVIYVVVNEFYVPSENPAYPYNNEVWLFKFSNNLWTRVHQRYHNIRSLIGSSGQDRAMWIEYHYTFNNGPGCTGQTHTDLGFMNYWHCKSSDGRNGNCSWYRPTSGNSFVSNDHSNPVTIRHVVPNYTFHVTKP